MGEFEPNREGVEALAEAFREVAIERVGPASRERAADHAAAEEPLEVQLHDSPFAVIMRTPGADRDLTAGFLLAEQVIRSPQDLASIDAGGPIDDNVIRVRLAESRLADVPGLIEGRREITQTSSCGMCGRRTIDSLRVAAPAIDATWTVTAEMIRGLPIRLRAAQSVFDQTGGLHAAGLFDRDGRLSRLAEDVGRHNAVDKVIGHMLLDGRLPLSESVLFVSGRTSFEIVQKAFLAGIPVLAAVSAPSTLAIELAMEVGLTLIGFVRGDTFNVYAHGFRIEERA